MKARLVSYTQWNPEYLAASGIPDGLVSPEGPVAYTARVSSPNPMNESYAKLLAYCISKGHWSVFEMADATVEIETSRAIAAQILRHKSFNFQELSQRYSAIPSDYQATTCRMQDPKNRQSSIPCNDEELRMWWEYTQNAQAERAFANYDLAIQLGIAKEVARMLLPLSVTTRLYMKGSLRSWLHYLAVRLEPSTQLEHRELAQAILAQLAPVYPVIFEAAKQVYPHLT